MFIDQDTLKRVNIYRPYKDFSKLDTPEIRALAGVVEIPDPARGDDNLEYTQELTDPPYIIITPKSQEQIDAYLARVAQEAADTDAKENAKADAVVQYLRDHTPAECVQYVQDNVTDLASAKQLMKKFAIVLCVLSKQNLR